MNTLEDIINSPVKEIAAFGGRAKEILDSFDSGDLTMEQCASLLADEKRLLEINEAMEDLEFSAKVQQAFDAFNKLRPYLPFI